MWGAAFQSSGGNGCEEGEGGADAVEWEDTKQGLGRFENREQLD